MFQSPEMNPRCAQLIFNAHDVNLLDLSESAELGRDQIWLAEKAEDGATQIRSVAEYKLGATSRLGGVIFVDVTVGSHDWTRRLATRFGMSRGKRDQAGRWLGGDSCAVCGGCRVNERDATAVSAAF